MTDAEDNQNHWQPRRFHWHVLVFVLLALVFWAFLAGVPGGPAVKQLSYTQFLEAVQSGRVDSVTLHGQKVRGQFVQHSQAQGQGQKQKTGQASGKADQPGSRQPKKQTFVTTRPKHVEGDLLALLEKKNVNVRVKPVTSHWWSEVLINLLPLMIMIAVVIFVVRRMRKRMGGGQGQGGFFSLGRSQARRYRERSTGVTMGQVAGADNAKADVQEIIDYLREPGRYHRLGAEIPRGVLLMGPPGTGKTLLAKAIAGEADVPFYSISGSEFIEIFVGVGASRVRDMFRNARREAPAIIFIDELDAIGRARGTGIGGGHDEREQTLNQILSEMDGFENDETVVVVAATNRPDVLDPALMRPGRFDRKILIDRPHREARLAILRVHVQDKPLSEDVDLLLVARRTAGFSGAELSNLANEAALAAGRRGQHRIDMDCFNHARDKIMLGAPREERLTDRDKKVIAYHECGHALLAWLLPNAEPPDRVTIIPRGQALGATEQNPTEERYNVNESDLRDHIGVMLGGRTAEKLVFGEVSTGAQQDLKQATDLVRKMVSEWGMSERMGATAFPRSQAQPFLGQDIARSPDFSEQTAEMVDAEIRRIVDEIDENVTRLLGKNKPRLEALAKRLLDDETLASREIESILGTTAAPTTG